MPAYMIVELEVIEPAAFQQYSRDAARTVEQYGGRFLVRGGQTDSLEGEPPRSIVVVAFATMETARRWYDSSEYVALKPARIKAARARAFLVEGIPGEQPV